MVRTRKYACCCYELIIHVCWIVAVVVYAFYCYLSVVVHCVSGIGRIILLQCHIPCEQCNLSLDSSTTLDDLSFVEPELVFCSLSLPTTERRHRVVVELRDTEIVYSNTLNALLEVCKSDFNSLCWCRYVRV